MCDEKLVMHLDLPAPHLPTTITMATLKPHGWVLCVSGATRACYGYSLVKQWLKVHLDVHMQWPLHLHPVGANSKHPGAVREHHLVAKHGSHLAAHHTLVVHQ